jgi:hypothetical protein
MAVETTSFNSEHIAESFNEPAFTTQPEKIACYRLIMACIYSRHMGQMPSSDQALRDWTQQLQDILNNRITDDGFSPITNPWLQAEAALYGDKEPPEGQPVDMGDWSLLPYYSYSYNSSFNIPDDDKQIFARFER